VSDAQKYFTLKYRGRGLITNGFFSHVRNPNYLGETLIYSAFCLLTRSYIAWGILAFFFIIIFVPNMKKKDLSLSKYPEFAAYAKRSSLIIPFIW